MLILTRKPGEQIRINSNIVIKIVSTNENNVKIGIEAPADITILREELYQNVKNNILEAAKKPDVNVKLDLSQLTINKLRKENNETA